MQMRRERVRNARLKMSLKLEMESSLGNLSKGLHLFLFEPYLRTSSMKLVKRLEMLSSSNNLVDFVLVLKGFEAQRDMGRL